MGVVTWIPRRVKDDDAIVANQIHPQTPDFGGHEEKQNFRTGIEFIHHLLSVKAGCFLSNRK